jgi:predicted AAA+ superfamily ATPase
MIEKAVLREVIAGNAQTIAERATSIIPRVGVAFPDNLDKTIVLYGVRRSGKTFILYDLFLKRPEESLYVDFEDDRLRDFTVDDFDLLRTVFQEVWPSVEGGPRALFLDEVQNVDGWEKFCRRAVEREGLRIYVSGSSSRMMPAEIHTELRGRSWSIEVMPFSFPEYCVARGVPAAQPANRHGRAGEKIRRAFSGYLRWGGFPEVARLESDHERRKLLGEYYGAMYFRDLVERYAMTNIPLLDALSERIFSAFATKLSLTAFYNQHKDRLPFSKDLLFRYHRAILDSMLAFEVRKFSESAYVRQRNPAKIYPVDPGLCRRVTSEDAGRLLETVVFLELHRRGYEVFYFDEGRECDFVTRGDDGTLQALQVTLELSERNRQREVEGLVAACQRIGAREGLLLTLNDERELEHDGLHIHVRPVWRWLLEK